MAFGREIVFALTAQCGRILEWKEGKGRTIPIKKIYSKCSPTTQAQFHTSEAKTYVITYRGNNAEKSTMQSIVAECLPHQLFYGTTYIDDVWIDDVDYNYDETVIEKHWVITLTLVRVGEFGEGHLREGEEAGGVVGSADEFVFYPNSTKPYYYNGWYYVFMRWQPVGFYRMRCYKSEDGASWTLENGYIDWSYENMCVFGLDDKIIILYERGSGGWVSKTGTIQGDGSIVWSAKVDVYPVNPFGATTGALYGFKINGSRYWFAYAAANEDQIRIHWSTDDGATWNGGNYCDMIISFGAFVVPYANSSNPLYLETVFNENPRILKARERNGAVCGGLDQLTTSLAVSGIIYDGVCVIRVGDYMHVVYLDTSGVIKHKRATWAGSWEELEDVRTGLTATTNITLCYDEVSGILFILYTVWNTATTSWDVRFKEWNPSTETLSPDGYDYVFYNNEDETNIARLTAYPHPVNEGVIIVWNRGTTVRFFRKQMLVK